MRVYIQNGQYHTNADKDEFVSFLRNGIRVRL